VATAIAPIPGEDDSVLADVASRLDIKAGTAGRMGLLYMLASIGIGLAILLFFYIGAQRAEIDNHYTRPSPVNEPDRHLTSLMDILAGNVGTGILRIGMVLIGIFLIQILVGFARYYFRLSEHIAMSAELVRLGKGNSKTMKELAAILMPTFEFGKMPQSPLQKIVDTSMDTVKELAKKIPAR
jgi:type IV secretory pathway VirB2 component (pilin)